MTLKIEHPIKDKERECDLCGFKWKLTYNYVKNPNWNPPYTHPDCPGKQKLKLV